MTTDDPWMEEQLLLLEQLEEDAALVTREEFRARADALGCTLDELVADTVQRTRRRRLFARVEKARADACERAMIRLGLLGAACAPTETTDA